MPLKLHTAKSGKRARVETHLVLYLNAKKKKLGVDEEIRNFSRIRICYIPGSYRVTSLSRPKCFRKGEYSMPGQSHTVVGNQDISGFLKYAKDIT